MVYQRYLLFIALCAVAANAASIRFPRQSWGSNQVSGSIGFDQIEFPDEDSGFDGFPFNPGFEGPNRGRPGNPNLIPPGNRPDRPSWGQNPGRPSGGRRTTTTTTTTTTTMAPTTRRSATSSTTSTTQADRPTPRTFHLVPVGCNCPSTPQFNPVCGSDGNTYKNSGLLECFRACGTDVTQRRLGSC